MNPWPGSAHQPHDFLRRLCLFAAPTFLKLLYREGIDFRSMMQRRQLLFLAAGLVLGPFARGAAEDPVVALPPMIVEETAQGLPWRYADVGGLEVLSSCPERLTRGLIANHHR